MNYNQALEIAKKYHHGQKRHVTGLPYITRPMNVAEKFEDVDYKIVAVLHDALEDTKLTSFDLSDKYKLDLNLVIAIEVLTRNDNQTYLDYILKCKNNGIARAVKIEDIKDNLSDNPTKSKIDKYLMALYILELPYISPDRCGAIKC